MKLLHLRKQLKLQQKGELLLRIRNFRHQSSKARQELGVFKSFLKCTDLSRHFPLSSSSLCILTISTSSWLWYCWIPTSHFKPNVCLILSPSNRAQRYHCHVSKQKIILPFSRPSSRWEFYLNALRLSCCMQR